MDNCPTNPRGRGDQNTGTVSDVTASGKLPINESFALFPETLTPTGHSSSPLLHHRLTAGEGRKRLRGDGRRSGALE